ncbi:MAG: isopentenyl-diphosphate Delta-isomerase [Bacteroidetes bacterium]|nr:MAG: isopentenyl-diphosphate Delta-isomerase [Bacteroidota bacterium]
MIETQVILVNSNDEPIGTMEKMAAHEAAHLHRAFSVFLFNAEGHMLLQKRASTKYHSGGLWTNTCCSHPFPGEDTEQAAQRRLAEEMGITNATIHKAFHFTYTASFSNGLVECEFDHVFCGQYNGPIVPNPDEVEAYRYTPLPQLLAQVHQKPQYFTAWFLLALPKLQAHYPQWAWGG